MPNITYKSCYYLFILLHEKFFVTPPVSFVTRIFSETFLTKKPCFSFKEKLLRRQSFSLRCRSNDANIALKLSGSYSEPSFLRISAKNFCHVSSTCLPSYESKLVSKFLLSAQTFSQVVVLFGFLNFASVLESLDLENLKIFPPLFFNFLRDFGYYGNCNFHM